MILFERRIDRLHYRGKVEKVHSEIE